MSLGQCLGSYCNNLFTHPKVSTVNRITHLLSFAISISSPTVVWQEMSCVSHRSILEEIWIENDTAPALNCTPPKVPQSPINMAVGLADPAIEKHTHSCHWYYIHVFMRCEVLWNLLSLFTKQIRITDAKLQHTEENHHTHQLAFGSGVAKEIQTAFCCSIDCNTVQQNRNSIAKSVTGHSLKMS